MNPKDLENFLRKFPSTKKSWIERENDSDDDDDFDEFRRVILILFYAATNEGAHIKEIFPMITNSEIDDLKGYNLYCSHSKTSFYLRAKNEKYTHPANKVCARAFQKGEPVYRCEQCGFDDTCVLCMYCFNKKDHVDHDVTMYRSQGSNGGICDCGDPEAFVNELNCLCQTSSIILENDSEGMSKDFHDALYNTIKVVLDYILNVTNFSTEMIPYIHDAAKGSTDKTNNLANYAASIYKDDDAPDTIDTWFLILWNDEYHDWKQTERVIMEALLVSPEEANKIATEVDAKGRKIVLSGVTCTELFKAQSILESEGLVTTITRSSRFAKENLIPYLILWLKNITELSSRNGFREASKAIICDLLLQPNIEFTTTFPIDQLGYNDKIKNICYENGLLVDNEFPNCGLTQVKHEFLNGPEKKFRHSAVDDILETSISNDPKNVAKSRIQLLMLFEMRFPHDVRKMLPNFLSTVLVADSSKKAIFCQQLIQVYPNLLTGLGLADREDHLNFLNDITTQIFTCPASVQQIHQPTSSRPNGGLGNVLGPLISVIEEFSSKHSEILGFRNFIQEAGNPSVVRPIKRAIVRGIRDISHLVDKISVDANLVFSENNMIMLMIFLRYFQGYWPVTRKYGEHVEHEIMDFVIHAEYSIPILTIVKHVASYIAEDPKLSAQTAQLILNDSLQATIPMKSPGVADFRVSRDPVGFINPINSLLSFLVQYQGFDTFEQNFSQLTKPFMYVSDFSLRSLVLASQVKIGFWVRNGISVSRQTSLYTDNLMNDLTYFRDFHMQQVAAIIDDPRNTLFNFLDRWELLDWFSNEVTHDQTIYDDRFNSICEEFIIFIYNLITDRSYFQTMSSEERTNQRTRTSICYKLSNEPRAYSKLKGDVETEMSHNPDFDKILHECADYLPPTGLTDSGMYRLKPEIFLKLDPLSLYLDSNEFLSVSESLITQISKQKKVKEHEVVLFPNITFSDNSTVNENIGRFSKTKEFTKLVYKLFQVAIDTNDETYVSQLLHLVHAILLDEEAIGDVNHLSEQFVNIPVCNLLLTLVESTMSKNVVTKSEYLLSQLMSKDNRIVESLIDCFGQEHVDAYIQKQTGASESEADKKKRQAEERRKKVMKKFAKQRENFLAQNQELGETMQAEKQNEVSLRTCVYCGEVESIENMFGLFTTGISNKLWKLPPGQSYSSHLRVCFQDWDDQKLRSSNNEFGKGYIDSENFEIGPSPISVSRTVAVTCGHGMHISCYKQYCRQMEITDIPCPLCRVSHNVLVPSPIPPENGGGLSLTEIDRAPIYTKYNSITQSCGTNNSKVLFNSLTSADVKDYSQMSEMVRQFKENGLVMNNIDHAENFCFIQSLSSIIAETIRMHEVTSRIKGNTGYSDFLGSIPSTAISLIKSLMQYRTGMMVPPNSSWNGLRIPDYSIKYANFWDGDLVFSGVFSEVILLFFQTEESFLALARLGYSKLFAITVYSLLKRVKSAGNFSFLQQNGKRHLPKDTINSLRDLCFTYCETFEGVENTDFIEDLYFAIERCMLPYFRQLIIFKDILTSSSFGDNSFQSIPSLESLEEELLNSEYPTSSDILCQKLSLPLLKELISGLGNRDMSKLGLENSVFNIIINAKIPKHLSDGILSLDYPGVIKLIDIPSDFNACLTRPKVSLHDFRICLVCGTILKMGSSQIPHHMGTCSSQTGIFFHPRLNLLDVYSHLTNLGTISANLPAPYLTEHGEVRTGSVGKASLNEMRYQYINKLWLNQGLHAFVTRAVFSGNGSQNFNFDRMDDDFDGNSESEEDEEDDMMFTDEIGW